MLLPVDRNVAGGMAIRLRLSRARIVAEYRLAGSHISALPWCGAGQADGRNIADLIAELAREVEEDEAETDRMHPGPDALAGNRLPTITRLRQGVGISRSSRCAGSRFPNSNLCRVSGPSHCRERPF